MTNNGLCDGDGKSLCELSNDSSSREAFKEGRESSVSVRPSRLTMGDLGTSVSINAASSSFCSLFLERLRDSRSGETDGADLLTVELALFRICKFS